MDSMIVHNKFVAGSKKGLQVRAAKRRFFLVVGLTSQRSSKNAGSKKENMCSRMSTLTNTSDVAGDEGILDTIISLDKDEDQ